MYFEGSIGVDLAGTTLQLRPPANFFGGLANLMTHRKWSRREEQETYKLLALAQSVFRVLKERGIDNVIRVAVGPTLVYEDLERTPNDLETAMQRLTDMIELGSLDLGPGQEYDMLLSHDDGTLNTQIDFDFHRYHSLGELPVRLRFKAIPSDLRREPQETEADFTSRVEGFFADQEAFDAFRNRLEAHFRRFLDELAAGLRERLHTEDVTVNVTLNMVRRRDLARGEVDTGWGTPFYGYNPMWDLGYLWLLNDMLDHRPIHPTNFTYVDAGGTPLAHVGADGWTGDDFDRFDHGDSGGGGSLLTDTSSHDSGGGGDLAGAASGGDSGGGGWLSSIGGFFSGGDSGGGGDVGGGDSGGGGCGSCGGGGCSSS